MGMEGVTLYWFRRDLRLGDNHGLYQALKSSHPVLPIFIFDTTILDKLEDNYDARVTYLHDRIATLKLELEALGGTLLVMHGVPAVVLSQLMETLYVREIFLNKDYEGYAKARDAEVAELCRHRGVAFLSFKDHVIFEEKEVVSKGAGTPYTVFTPYSKAWKEKLGQQDSVGLRSFPSGSLLPGKLYRPNGTWKMPSLDTLGFSRSGINIPSCHINRDLVSRYSNDRNFPSQSGTSRLGIHLRFGTLGIRELAREVQALDGTFFNELIWRDFYAQILANFPHVERESFRRIYDQIPWKNRLDYFERWKTGTTGFPLVDAGMRELAATGFMHNRVRMLTASFLTKHLLTDWRWGEAWFAEKLLDFELASNNGGWQWAAGCGTDAAPYFRIFSPQAQLERFDPKLVYVRQWVPEYGSSAYPEPIIDHRKAVAECLEAYQSVLKPGG